MLLINLPFILSEQTTNRVYLCIVIVLLVSIIMISNERGISNMSLITALVTL